ncbi:hypothetical protein [Novosphingobium sp. BL-52-GroH]|uniref:hypothetical protein n=1 Tax=Novosphingobium sp. BL-52-GroH TaxID=3349877 RepID=UPI00384D87B0
MLSKLEGVYLAILRVAILVAASLALLVTIGVAVASGPSLLASAGFGGAEDTANGSLRQFMAEQKDQSSPGDETLAERRPEVETVIAPDIDAAAANFAKYLGTPGTAAKRNFSILLQGNADGLVTGAVGQVSVADAPARYGASVLALSESLLNSTGRKLSEERVHELIAWHFQHFVGELAADQARQASARADLMVKLGVAGAAFLAFVLIIFVFLFVKIERNLRGIAVQATPEGIEP